MKVLYSPIFFLICSCSGIAPENSSHESNSTDSLTDIEQDSNGDIDTDSNTELDTDSELDSDTATNSDTDVNTDSETESETDSESDNCYDGPVSTINNNLDLLEIEPFNCIDGWLSISQFTNIVLSLPNLKWVGQRFLIHSNADLKTVEFEKLSSVPFFVISGNSEIMNLNGFSNLSSVSENFQIKSNPKIPDCEVCDLLAQLDEEPYEITVHSNLDDSCTPVPDNCP